MTYLLQDLVPFSRSMLWELQRQYYAERGAAAWRLGEVPHYVTSNLRQANAYAEIVVSLYCDYRDKARAAGKTLGVMQVVELGAGSGRLGYYFLRRLEEVCERDGLDLGCFRLILTDFTPANLAAWAVHPRFTPYWESGLLDRALLDVTAPGALQLEVSGEVVDEQSLDAPLVVLANYVFDSLPQEQFCLAGGQLIRVGVALSLPEAPGEADAATLLSKVELGFTAVEDEDWSCPVSAAVLDSYVQSGAIGYFCLPVLGLRCIEYLRGWSKHGLLLLTADKGSQHLAEVLSNSPHGYAFHGSISMTVNYHAFDTYCRQQGGRTVFPEVYYGSVNTGCLMLLDGLDGHVHTWRTVRQQLDGPGPDSYFTVYRSIRRNLEQFEAAELLSALRLSFFDSHQFAIFLPQLGALLGQMDAKTRADLVYVAGRCWDNYFPMGEDLDLAEALGNLCYVVDAYDWALFYFSQSTGIYGGYTGTYYNMAVCHHMLGESGKAVALLDRVLQHDAANGDAKALRDSLVVEMATVI